MSPGQPSGKDWKLQPLRRYKQIWPQLLLVKGCVCRRYCPSPMSDVITVPVIPPSLQPKLLHQTHDEPSAGHQVFDKTFKHHASILHGWVCGEILQRMFEMSTDETTPPF